MVTVEECKEMERQQWEQEIIDAAEQVFSQEVMATLPWTRLPR